MSERAAGARVGLQVLVSLHRRAPLALCAFALFFAGSLAEAVASGVRAQEIQLGEASRPAASRQGHVSLLSDSLELSAGKAQTVELRFRVDPGFHINSHKPADQLMIPTSLKLDPNERVRVMDAQFPAGTPFRLNIGGGELLDVYQGEFRVVLKLEKVEAGETTLSGTLRYQACDNAACFPAKSLPVRVAVKAR